MDEYLKRYDSLDTIVVLEYDIRLGGIGDYLKFFIYLLQLCIQYNYQLHYQINHSAIEKLIRLKDERMYISSDKLVNARNLCHQDELSSLQKGIHLVRPYQLYHGFHNDFIHMKIEDVFYFSDEIKRNVILDSPVLNYTSIHLRLGDKHLDTDSHFIICKEDSRVFDKHTLINYIEANKSHTLVFFCDNPVYKQKMKQTYPPLILTKGQVAHSSLTNTTYDQIVDAVTEFYIMTESTQIVAVSESGYSAMAAKFKGIPLVRLYN